MLLMTSSYVFSLFDDAVYVCANIHSEAKNLTASLCPFLPRDARSAIAVLLS